MPTRRARIGAGPIIRRSPEGGRTHSAPAAGDPAATEDDLAVVENAGLAWRRGPDGLVGLDDPAAAAGRLGSRRGADRGRDRRRAVADPGLGAEARSAPLALA